MGDRKNGSSSLTHVVPVHLYAHVVALLFLVGSPLFFSVLYGSTGRATRDTERRIRRRTNRRQATGQTQIPAPLKDPLLLSKTLALPGEFQMISGNLERRSLMSALLGPSPTSPSK